MFLLLKLISRTKPSKTSNSRKVLNCANTPETFALKLSNFSKSGNSRHFSYYFQVGKFMQMTLLMMFSLISYSSFNYLKDNYYNHAPTAQLLRSRLKLKNFRFNPHPVRCYSLKNYYDLESSLTKSTSPLSAEVYANVAEEGDMVLFILTFLLMLCVWSSIALIFEAVDVPKTRPQRVDSSCLIRNARVRNTTPNLSSPPLTI